MEVGLYLSGSTCKCQLATQITSLPRRLRSKKACCGATPEQRRGSLHIRTRTPSAVTNHGVYEVNRDAPAPPARPVVVVGVALAVAVAST